jgi:hypothetical protein
MRPRRVTACSSSKDPDLADLGIPNANARGYKRGAKVRDPFQLRVNAYRVLLTRARDVCVLYVPPLGALDETHAYLRACGARDLIADGLATP